MITNTEASLRRLKCIYPGGVWKMHRVYLSFLKGMGSVLTNIESDISHGCWPRKDPTVWLKWYNDERTCYVGRVCSVHHLWPFFIFQTGTRQYKHFLHICACVCVCLKETLTPHLKRLCVFLFPASPVEGKRYTYNPVCYIFNTRAK